MRIAPRPSEVLSVVVGMFERFGATPQCLFELEETILIDRGKHTARTFWHSISRTYQIEWAKWAPGPVLPAARGPPPGHHGFQG